VVVHIYLFFERMDSLRCLQRIKVIVFFRYNEASSERMVKLRIHLENVEAELGK